MSAVAASRISLALFRLKVMTIRRRLRSWMALKLAAIHYKWAH
jgi:hypothetical protein